MKYILFIIIILFTANIYARDYSCLYHVVDRHDAKFVEKILEISSRGPMTACSKAKKSCEKYIETNKSTRQFCYKENESIFIHDLRFSGAKAYYLGELKERFTALCYGTTQAEAIKYCREKLMNLCEDFVKAKPEEDWYCSFY